MNLEDIVSNEISPTQKDKYSMISLSHVKSKTVELIETKNRTWLPEGRIVGKGGKWDVAYKVSVM